MSLRRPLSRTELTYLFIGWIALALIAGAFAFTGIWYASGGFDRSTPTPVAPVATSVPVTTATTEEAKALCPYPPEPASGFWYGIQMNPFISDNSFFMGQVSSLGLQWIKAQVRWRDLEPAPGEMNWGAMDNLMDTACEKGLRVMLSVVTAPAWTQASPLSQEAPPDDYQAYADFVGALAARYRGRIGAIEVWNEQNLEREWNTAAGIDPADYIRLLSLAHAAIKREDPGVVVISGAPAPTGITCRGGPFPENCAPDGRVIIMDDASYLSEFVRLGGLDVTDCVGTHSNGTNLPPDADGAAPPEDQSGYSFTGPWDNPHYSWALKSQLDVYWEIVAGAKPLCVTEFGYASPVDGAFPPGYEFAADITEDEQAEYLVQAFDLMRESGRVQGAWLFNLDYGPKGGDPSQDDNAIFSLLYRDGTARPAFHSIGAMTKS